MDQNCFYEFRVSKYYKNLDTGMPLPNLWTSISDIGQIFGEHHLTYAEYEQVERRYLQLIEQVCLALDIPQLQITSLENPFNICPYPNNSLVYDLEQIVDIARDCLREKYWCRLQSKKLYFHFGYDYYLYIGSPFDFFQMSTFASRVGLFIEEIKSPYN